MPADRPPPRASARVLSAMGRGASVAAYAAVVGIGLFAALLLVVRLVVFPDIDRYRSTIVSAIERQVGHPVAIDAIAATWDGWNPKLVIEGFRLDGPGGGTLELPRLDLTIAWTSLAALDLKLKQLVIERPRLAIRRDARGVVHVAGMEFDPEHPDVDTGLSDWLLQQREIVVHDALIAWTDEFRGAPQLVLDQVQFRLESVFGRRRFGLRGTPPAEIAAPIDVRGEFGRLALRDWRNASGRLYVRLDFADLAAWKEWLPLPVGVDSGKGALRAWFTLEGGDAREVTADVALADVRTRLHADLAELSLAQVSGRIAWRLAGSTLDVTSHQLGFTTGSGLAFAPFDLGVSLRLRDAGGTVGGKIAFDHVDLAPLRDIAPALPLPSTWREWLVRHAPQGVLSQATLQWDGPPEAPTAFAAALRFADLALLPVGSAPGGQGLAGQLQATQGGGTVKLAAREGKLSLPGIFEAEPRFDAIDGDITWHVDRGVMTVRSDRLQFSNADAAGRVKWTWRSTRSGPGDIDLEAELARADVEAVPRYLPLVLDRGIRDWVARAVHEGTIDEARVRLKGNLAQFPFIDGNPGEFTVDVKGRGFALDYADGWPAIKAIDAAVQFRGAGLGIVASRGRIYDVPLNAVKVAIADFRSPVLTVEGEAAGPTRQFLRFVRETPVASTSSRWLDDAEITGEGRLALKFTLPLRDLAANRVTGDYTFSGNELRLGELPRLSQLNGTLSFTQAEVRARDVAAETFAGPVRIGLNARDGRVRVRSTGTTPLATVRREFQVPFLDRAQGSVDWTLVVDAAGGAVSWSLESPLRQVAIDLPPPLRKVAGETLPLRIDRRAPAAGSTTDTLVATLGEIATIAARRRLDADAPRADRALVSLGTLARSPDAVRADRSGVWLRAELPTLDMDQWSAALKRQDWTASDRGPASELALAGIDLAADKVVLAGRDFAAVKVGARRRAEEWKVDLRARDVVGQATWAATTSEAPSGRLAAQFTRLAIPKAVTAVAAERPAESAADPSTNWPELDVRADTFISAGGRDLGRLELVAKPAAGEWRIERLSLAMDSGRLEGTGAWRPSVRPQQTVLDTVLDVKDAGAFLARFGHAGAVQGAAAKITGQLAWAGAPSDFDYPSLSGAFRVDVGPGRFMKIEPGLGKLLGVISLQALPRRITLDFRDVFSDGFTFDQVTGNVRIANGVMTTDDLRLRGTAAQVTIMGSADIAHETQRLRVRVQPALSGGVSAAALLFFANPLVGAAVGAGSLLAQKVLRDPLEQIFSYEYSVTGSWSDPQVTRATTATASVPSDNPK